MLDVVNEQLTLAGKEPIAFDHDCREGICGTCGAVVNGRPHGPKKGTTLCQLHMRHFSSGDILVIEPWRSRAFKVIKDLVVDRSAFDQIIQAGGYISASTGGTQDANAILISQETVELAMDAGAEDITTESGSYEIITTPENLEPVREAMETKDIPMVSAEIVMRPQNSVKLETEKEASSMLKMYELLEEADDVQKVWTNFDIDESLLEKLA